MSLGRMRVRPLVLVAALLLALAMACQRPSPTLEPPMSSGADVKAERDRLAMEVDTLQKELAAAQSEVGRLGVELEGAQSALGKTQEETQRELAQRTKSLQGLAEALARDHLLLIEVRKPDPEAREEGLRYWGTVRQLALASGPELMGPVDKVLSLAPAYYDWQERAEAGRFVSSAEASALYQLWVAPYQKARDGFLQASLLSVIGHLDAAVEGLDSIIQP